MQTRHRIPSIFSLSMVDVLCCALGCVLLLWLLNMREARDRAAAASQAHEQLAAIRQELQSTQEELTASRQQLQSTQGELAASRQQLAGARQELESARAEAARLLRTITELGTELDKSKQQAAANRQRYLSAEEKAAATAALLGKVQTERDTARATIADLEKKLAAAGLRAQDLAGRIGEAETRIKQLQAMADLVPGLRDELKSYRDKLTSEQALVQSLEKTIKQRVQELTDLRKELDELRAVRRDLEQGIAARDKDLARANANLMVLQGEKKTLQSEVSRARAAAENRFAGISLTGRRVVFLIDKSGSMGLLDQNTPAKDKWPVVAQTAARIMRSLPELEKFQVIVFSTDASYLLGRDGQWIDYDPKTSADHVLQALIATEPKGGTNLYAAFDAAFRLRPLGLDTIYLLSDGIPDRGVGLPPGGDNLPAVERSDILSKHVRRTLRADWNREQPGQPRVRINCVGFFFESPDVGAFLWALARENDGSFVGMSKP
ncbi:MAG TPA: VWA domain-containing protein [Gemmataceae bacterium]|nr:VWA domain-containing protein [Gemmataceae bacterium]